MQIHFAIIVVTTIYRLELTAKEIVSSIASKPTLTITDIGIKQTVNKSMLWRMKVFQFLSFIGPVLGFNPIAHITRFPSFNWFKHQQESSVAAFLDKKLGNPYEVQKNIFVWPFFTHIR